MNDEPRRRRRLDEDGEGSGWLSMVALIVVVVLVGLLLGAVLARVFGAKTTVVVAPTAAPALVVTAEPSLTPLPSESSLPSSAPTFTPKAAATPAGPASPAPTVATTSPRPSPKATVAPTSSPRPHPSPSSTPRATATPSPKPHPKPVAIVTAHPGPQTAADRAEGVARLYLDALSRGKTAEARSYLASGEPTESSFMDASAHIVSLRSSPNADGSYKVDADLTTSNGEYYVAFTVEVTPGGAVITDHTSIKP